MKTKIVYALSSDDNDMYLEQILLSSYSLKLHNSHCHAILVVDDKTEKNLVDKRMQIMNNIDELVVVKTPQNLSKHECSRYLKTTLREHIQGDYLFIDGDTIICSSLEIIDQCPYEVAAVLDCHNPVYDCHNPIYDGLRKQLAFVGYAITTEQDKLYYNSGVMYVKDTPKAHELYKTWHQIWNNYRIEIGIDQPALAKANSKMGYVIKELDGIWNCQILVNGLRFLHEAYIIHYFSSGLRISCYFANTKIFRQIKENKCIIPVEVQQCIKNAKSAFASECEMLAGDLYYSPVIRFVIAQYIYHRWVYDLLNKIVCLYQIMVKCIKRWL